MTTIVLIRKNNEVVVAGDGQVSMGNTVIKKTANKVRKIEKRNVIAGFAGSTADALTLFERLESKLEKHAGNLARAAGSGGNYALASAKVLMDTDLSAEEIAKKAIKVASDICVFTNDNLNIEKI